VGRLRPGPLLELQKLYLGRLTAWRVELREVEERRKLPPAELKEREAALLVGAVPERATLVALDERGRNLTSAEFAERLRAWQDRGAELAFAIGGADGHGAAVTGRAELSLAFGALTWPHLLARIMLLEQLYRAQAILQGHPYHRA
jgi:23S rRNA (pseudouridine1915-N3)-methyltransferase